MTLRVGVIGAGIMGSDHATILHRWISGARLGMIVDIDADRARQRSEQLAASWSTDAAELIEDSDAVIIASHDSTHPELILACLDAGKPVMCEKPLAPTLAEAVEVYRAEQQLIAQQGGPELVSIGFMRRFDPASVVLAKGEARLLFSASTPAYRSTSSSPDALGCGRDRVDRRPFRTRAAAAHRPARGRGRPSECGASRRLRPRTWTTGQLRHTRAASERAELGCRLVATTHPAHLPTALLSVEAGKHTVVEKPLGAWRRGSTRWWRSRSGSARSRSVGSPDAARQARVLCMEALWTLFLPKFDVIRRVLDSGMLGDVRSVLADHGE
jgi:Oxidoreductase family, NAD-binding Rossmann fold